MLEQADSTLALLVNSFTLLGRVSFPWCESVLVRSMLKGFLSVVVYEIVVALVVQGLVVHNESYVRLK